MAKEMLDTNRVNYLIWRYLVESDYTETAVRLQKEWNLPDPQQLSFATHVQNHALVSVLNRGLLYNVQERLASQPNNGEVAVEVSGTGFFGPLMPPSPAADEDFENARKRQIDNEHTNIQSGPPAKKPRISNGYDQRFESSTPMEVDEEQNGDEQAYPSPEQAPSPAVVTNGPETGTQVDKVLELSSETTFLELSDDPASKNTVLLQCVFHPQDPTILAAAGTDALARMWTLSRMNSISASGAESPGKPVFASHRNLLEDGVSSTTTATGLAWDSRGKCIAVASEPQDDNLAKIEFWNFDGSSFATYNGFDSPIVCIRWSPLDTSLLAISPRDNKDTLITVMYPTMEGSAKYVISGHSLMDQSLEAAWTANDEFVICGGDILQAFTVAGDVITPSRKFEVRPGSSLSKLTWDKHSRLLAVASDFGVIDIWDQMGGRNTFNAHQGQITGLEWQPLHPPVFPGDDSERILASAGEDGAISLWNARSLENKSKASMTMGSAVVALAFTPDGAFIAGATNENVLIWKTDDVHLPRATWARPLEPGWQTPKSHDSVTDEDQFLLCWDASGHKLAYGVNSRLAVINLQSE